jgi:rare lipoprotein A
MSSISCARTFSAPSAPAAGVVKGMRLLAIVLGAASLAACAQSPITKNAERAVAKRQASLEHRTIFATNRRVQDTVQDTERRAPSSPRNAASTETASHGLASFYSTGRQTASGEAFDRSALTAAHRTLPFGTRLRVTNVATGQSVTVRVNDRGPFIPGRVVDVSHSAAEALGMVGDGVAKVKVDVVQ